MEKEKRNEVRLYASWLWLIGASADASIDSGPVPSYSRRLERLNRLAIGNVDIRLSNVPAYTGYD